jgi:archaellum biogenesis protein FlaJ (TadC family)
MGRVMKEEVLQLRRRLEVTERELRRLSRFEWGYTKQLWKFSLLSWILGVSLFFLLVLLYEPSLLTGVPQALPLLVAAAAAPLLAALYFVGRVERRVKNLERSRELLLSRYKRALLEHFQEAAS